MKSNHISILVILSVLIAASAQAASISINMAVDPAYSGLAVDPGQTSIIGISGTEAIDGSEWNNINLRNAGTAGKPTYFDNQTQGGNSLEMMDSSGANAGVAMTSSGAFYSAFANVSAPNQTSTGDAGLMQSCLNMNSSESVSLSGLSTWSPSGYMVYAVFDLGTATTRTYGVSMTDGITNQIFWTTDNGIIDSDTNDDGIMEWQQTTATTSGTAVTSANYAVFGPFTGDTLTISGDATSGRACVSGIQIVALGTVSTAHKYWSGSTDGNWSDTDSSSLNWTGTNYTYVKSNFSSIYFGDVDGSGNPVATSTITIGAGGVTGEDVNFINNSVAYTFNSMDANGLTGPYSVTLSGTGSVTFNGGNTYTGDTILNSGASLTLNGANTYTGQTFLDSGASLTLGSSGSIADTTQIWMSAGSIIDATAPGLTLNSSATLIGYGTIKGDVSAPAGASLVPGNAGAFGTLTFDNDLTLNGQAFTLDVGGATNASDHITVGGVLTMNANSVITLSEAAGFWPTAPIPC